VGVKGLTGVARRLRNTLRIQSGIYGGLSEMSFLPLTLTLSPKGRGEITFDNTFDGGRRFL
jgi:hypothetical protein